MHARKAILAVLLMVALIGSMGAINLQLVPNTLPALTPDSTSVDNGPNILEYIKQNAVLPKGRYYVSSTIMTPESLTGLGLRGTGMTDFVRGDGAWDDPGMNSTVLIWNGVADGILLQINSGAFRVEDIALIGHSVPVYNDLSEAYKTGTCVRIYQGPAPTQKPVGHIQFNRLLIGVGKYGILANGTTHCDHVSLYDVAFHYVSTPIKIDQNQSVEWFGRAITAYPGGGTKGNAVIEASEGGRVDMQLTALDNWSSIIKGPLIPSGTAAYNYGHYHIQFWLDNTTHIDNVIVERSNRSDEAGAWVCDIDGYAAENTDLGRPRAEDGSINPLSRLTVNLKRTRPVTPDFIYPNPAGSETVRPTAAPYVAANGHIYLAPNECLTGVVSDENGTGWTITASGGAVTAVGSLDRGTQSCGILLSRTIKTGETVTIAFNSAATYTSPYTTSGGAAANATVPLAAPTDMKGNLLNSISTVAITNNSTVAP